MTLLRNRTWIRRSLLLLFLLSAAEINFARTAIPAQQDSSFSTPQAVPEESATQPGYFSVREFLAAGGVIGFVILVFSFLMLALIIDAAMTTRRSQMIPPSLAESVHRLIAERKRREAVELCRQSPGFLAVILEAGLAEMSSSSWPPIEKAMEDSAVEQGARCSRRVEYLAIISTLAPMLGLMGTVWGMIVAFMEFELKANPQISELAPGIYKALVTTLLGLGVAIPATAALAFFRSRIEDLTAEATLLADRVFADYRRTLQHNPSQPASRT